jgi:hypothetical protein
VIARKPVWHRESQFLLNTFLTIFGRSHTDNNASLWWLKRAWWCGFAFLETQSFVRLILAASQSFDHQKDLMGFFIHSSVWPTSTRSWGHYYKRFSVQTQFGCVFSPTTKPPCQVATCSLVPSRWGIWSSRSMPRLLRGLFHRIGNTRRFMSVTAP